VLCASTRADIEATAFLNSNGEVAAVALNRHAHQVGMQLSIDGAAWAIDLPPHSISTFVAPAA
jgi:O-glycosyl hydrolase